MSYYIWKNTRCLLFPYSAWKGNPETYPENVLGLGVTQTRWGARFLIWRDKRRKPSHVVWRVQ